MMKFSPRLVAFALSGMPHENAEEACNIMIHNFPEALSIPYLALSKRGFLAHSRFFGGMPCLEVDWEKETLRFNLSSGRESELVEFYDRYMSDDLDYFAIKPELEPALYKLAQMYKEQPWPELKLVQFNVPGPYSFGLRIQDESGVPAFYNDTMRDIIVKQLTMKARWSLKTAKDLFPGVEVSLRISEASLAVFESPGGIGSWDVIEKAINEVLQAGEGRTCIHCCANFDWSMLMATKTDCINFDAYQYGETMSLYPEALKKFLARGGTIAWGIVPTTGSGAIEKDIERESPSTLLEKLERAIQSVADRGIDKEQLLQSSWITPSCVPTTLSLELAERIYEYTAEISRVMRQKYFS